jgi:hypothetical protein
VILVLRFIGILNAAIWLGGSIFFTFAVAPAFFSGEIKVLESQGRLHPFYPGAIAQLVLQRYFYLSYVCGALAVAHQLAEWVYLGRALRRLTVGVLTGLVIIGGLGGLWLQPKLKQLHLTKYGMTAQYTRTPVPASDAERLQAGKSFRIWHGVAQSINLLGLAGLMFYFWRVTHPSDNLRALSGGKFRS